jgi:hypothetical protein
MNTLRALMVSALLLSPAAALAQDDDTAIATDETSFTTADGSLTDRPLFFGAGVGLRTGLQNGGFLSFQLEEHIGYRIFGFDLADRLDAALWVGAGFGQAFGDFNSVLLSFDGRFGADFEIWDGGDMQLLATPFVGLGGGVVIFDGPFGNTSDGAFHMQFAAQAELVLADGLIGIFLRPLSFDFFIWNDTWTSYQLLTGVNIRI